MDSSPTLAEMVDQVTAEMPPDIQHWLLTMPPNERTAVILGAGFAILVIFGLITAAIAGSKGRNTVGWFFAGFFFTLLGVIVAAVMPSLRRERRVAVTNADYAAPAYGRDGLSGSAADEIAKAKRLLDDGAITRAEFETIKARALARG